MAYISIYDYKDYKAFVIDWINLTPSKGRGQRMRLAEAIGCQTPFITHVLSGDYHFSLEQAEACARWMALNEVDTEFFVLLVMQQRSGTKQAAQVFERQLARRRQEENLLKKRLKIKEGLSPEDQIQYYSNWYYAAIHMALLNPRLQTVEALQEYFQLSRIKVLSVIDFLNEKKLIEVVSEGKEQRKKTLVKTSRIHLEKSSPLMAQHHVNWRLKAIDEIKEKNMNCLHYSSVISLSEADFDWIKSKLSLLLEEVADRVKNSPDEKIAALNFDWFEL